MWLDSNLHRSVLLHILDSGFPVGLYDKEHAYADAGEDIIHEYVQLLQIHLQQSGGDSYSEENKDRKFVWTPIYQSITKLPGVLGEGRLPEGSSVRIWLVTGSE